jgi:hypothetical protein
MACSLRDAFAVFSPSSSLILMSESSTPSANALPASLLISSSCSARWVRLASCSMAVANTYKDSQTLCVLFS